MCYREENSKRKLRLVKSIKDNYRYVIEPLVNVKSAFISICADIDRYIRLSTGCEIRKELDEGTVEKLKELYPCLSGLNTEQWNRLLLVYINIRNDNAHLYQNKPIYLDRDILSYLEALVNPEMTPVVHENELTLYGAYYVLAFLAQKFQLWLFVTSLMRGQNFSDMGKKEFAAFQKDSQHRLQEFCGIGKPIGNAEGQRMVDLAYLNDTLRRELTSVFLGLEAVALDKSLCLGISPSFRSVLGNIPPITQNQALFDRMTELRNIWFHGHWLGDDVTMPDGSRKRFDFYEAIETLRMLREALIDYEKYDSVTLQIESFGKALLDLKVLRLVEVSYKILDSRLLTLPKLEERLSNMAKAYEMFIAVEDRYYEAASSLLLSGPVTWYVCAAKFSNADYLPRETKVEELKIIKLHSDSGFDIGHFHTNVQDLILCDVVLPDGFSLTINGRALSQYPLVLCRDVCKRIKVYRADMTALAYGGPGLVY